MDVETHGDRGEEKAEVHGVASDATGGAAAAAAERVQSSGQSGGGGSSGEGVEMDADTEDGAAGTGAPARAEVGGSGGPREEDRVAAMDLEEREQQESESTRHVSFLFEALEVRTDCVSLGGVRHVVWSS